MGGESAARRQSHLLLKDAAGRQHGRQAAVGSLELVEDLEGGGAAMHTSACAAQEDAGASTTRTPHLGAPDGSAVRLKLGVLQHPHAGDAVQGPPVHAAGSAAIES